MIPHLFDSLQSAARLAVHQEGFTIQEINLERWAITYRCSVDDVEQALKIAMNGSRRLPEEVAAMSKPMTVEEVGDE